MSGRWIGVSGTKGNYARQLVETLAAQGVRRIYGLVGDSLNPVVDAVRLNDDIEWVHVHNEESAAFAAGAESLITGQLAVCAASCGPGNTHLIQGLYDAHRNGAKVLAIASHIPSQMIGTSSSGDPPRAAVQRVLGARDGQLRGREDPAQRHPVDDGRKWRVRAGHAR